ncbi:Putative beta-lactamase-inhibitor-like, PepSY-like [Cnuella takakiae]|uniref:Putative beta-lactamase-inhibitor-like, PepSY-like n=2 Tax=Cnuella takakiae TaxID=1302690 RepID=A0A1M4SMV6_9BACT|nr:hypothetical protein BUE76_23770 [Cnuella takakiae]SHE33550.1 Putative beta-lactamase-inhibitor-like, PepSY-like [Cnuella takakiae]
MKSLLIAAALAVLTVSCNAQANAKDAVPQKVKESFAKMHPGVQAKWEKEDSDYEAIFRKTGKEMSVVFHEDGQLLEEETEILANQLPANALAYVSKQYPGKEVKEAAKIVDAFGKVVYEVVVAGKDLLFTPAGEFIKIVGQ